MSLFDDLAGKAMEMLNSSGGSDSGLLGGIIGSLAPGGLGGLLQSFQEKGLGDTVASWVGTGENLPISADQIQSVLGSETIQNLASNFGISTDEISSLIAQHLPGAVDTLTPDGSLPEES
ncbi:MAG: DUF937 domain-containing protein [Desulfuromonadales bacterium]|nr:DUF937 domain-containing protein [Desulfuromonadales bacterium]